jgi:hypothetical protein
LQIFLDPLSLTKQEWDVLIRGLHEMPDNPHGVLEFLDEFFMLLVTPGVTQADQLPVQDQELVLQLVIELFEVMSKPLEFGWIDNGLRHETTLGAGRTLLQLMPRKRPPDGDVKVPPPGMGTASVQCNCAACGCK